MFCYDYPRPQVACDVALFAGPPGAAQVLLIRRGREPFKGQWALPGGFLGERETVEACAGRELAEETGVTGVALEQVGVFSDPDRDPRGRTLSVAFVGSLSEPVEVRADDDAAEARWWPVGGLPDLAFDHDRIIAAAVSRLA